MTTYTNLTDCAGQLAAGEVGIIPTDTIYGIVADAHNQVAVQKVYDLKGRNPDKPCIILIDRPETITEFGVPLAQIQQVAHYWPGALSVIFGGIGQEFAYLHRGTSSLAFRMPKNSALQDFLAATGPLIAPSANPEGQPPATTSIQAQNMFGEKANFYVDNGELHGEPSTVVRLQSDGTLEILRQGVFQLPA